MMWSFIILGFIFLLPSSEGSHFRGAIITWKPTGNYNEILVTFRISWRRSYTNLFCNDDTIRTQTLIGVSDNMNCLNYCLGTIGSMQFYCTDYSVQEDWTSGKKSFTYSATVNYFEFGYIGQAWIDNLRQGGGGYWELRVTANLSVRSDTRKVNSAPETDMAPIIRLVNGCQHTISIPVNDPDRDTVRCRKASNAKKECGGICDVFPAVFYEITNTVQKRATKTSLICWHTDLVEDACLIIFNATNVGWYGVAVQIEDFPNVNSRQPLSSIPLQFLVNVFDSPKGCVASPEFLPLTRPKDSCIGVPTGTTYFEPIVARSRAPGENITEITTVSEIGMTKSPLAEYPDSAYAWYVNISWTPTDAQSGHISIFCFTARDTLSLTTAQRCINLVAGEAGPTIINGTQSPTGIIFLDHRNFSVQFDQEFVRPKESRFIYIYNQNSKLIESIDATSSRNVIHGDNSKLEFIASSRFEDQMTYYVLFQSGVVRGKTFCGIESPPIRNQVFWTFMAITPDTTPPVLTFTENPSISNGSITIQWSFNERATARCWVFGPILIESARCNDLWSGSSLTGGHYTIYIQGTDLAGNIADPVQHAFSVDRTPPHVTITKRPHAVSKEQNVDFQLNCDESCYMECSVHNQTDSHTDFAPCFDKYFGFLNSFHVQNLISDKTYMFEVRAQDRLGNTGEVVKYTWQTDFAPPEINCTFISRNISCISNTNPVALGSPSVKDNIANNENISLTYMDNSHTQNRCMLQRQWTAIDTAGNSASCLQDIIFYSSESLVLKKYPEHAAVACGELTDMTEVFKQMFLVQSPCGLPTEITYRDDHPEKRDVCGAKLNRTWTITDNCIQPSVYTQLIQILGVQKPITPTSGERGIDLQYTLRWSPYEGSSSYQVYIWKVGSTRPNISMGRTTNTYFTPPKPLDAGTKYFWQVEFILGRVNQTLFGTKWGFETRSFTDLIVKSIEVPPVAYSGRSFDVKWTIQNIGNLSTETSYGYWYDNVYLSFTNNFGTSMYVGHKMQRTILYPGDAYSSQMTVPLRQDDLGLASIFVYTNKDNYITEINRDNNLLESLRSVDVQLTPPPDLHVIGVRVPSRSFSGKKISVLWTVINSGTGVMPPSQSHWYDRIYLSNDRFLDSSDVVLETVMNSRVMIPTEQYSKNQLVQIPEYITGNFSILIKTDSTNIVYEHLYEDNNVNASENSIYIMMQPIPDLSIIEINIPEEVRTGNDLTIQWQVTNTGAETARGPWHDQVTMTQMIGTLSLKLGYNLQYNSISPGEEYRSSVTIPIPPTLPSGAYVVAVDIDYENRVFESTSKTNNRRAKKILVRQALPNLSVDIFYVNLVMRDNINYVEVYAKILNTGQGKTYPPLSWVDSIDIVYSESWEENNLARFTFSFRDGILPDSYYEINRTLEIPPELHGVFTFSITVDKFHNIEDTNRADNMKEIGPKTVSLLAPDLLLAAPSMDSIEVHAGQNLLVSYMATNIGSPIKEQTEWIDRVILSMSKTDVRNLITFAERFIRGSFIKNATYNGNISLTIPKNIVGEFYIHIVINNGQKLYEGERFENNIKILPIMIASFPSPDLAVVSIVVDKNRNPEFERILVISWSVRNQGNSMTSEASWTDSILLSSELLTNKFDFSVTGALGVSAEYYMKRTIVIPESFVGTYNINVKTNSLEELDELGATANNIGPHWSKVTFEEIPAAMLSSSIVSVVRLNDTITTGRSVQISYLVTNIGHARTTKQSWIDVIFASRKENLSFKELGESGTILLRMTHIGGLDQGQGYSHEVVVVIPLDYNATSFFFVVADFDASADEAYAGEHTTETMQHISISNSSQMILPPFKLPNLIPTITALNNNSLRGGQPFTFEYEIQNTGKGQVISSWYDSVYLSDDFEMDPFDRKIITIFRKAAISVNESSNFSMTVFIPFDLESKNYFLMIFVDSRNEIFEEDENDNNLPISIFIEQSVSTDIAINEVKAPSVTVYGDSMTIEWTIINNGSRKAFGYKCDTVYFSKDNILSIDDIQIADSLCNGISIGPYSNTSDVRRYNIMEHTPLASAGSYKAIVRSRSNIFDSNQNNNVLASDNSTYIGVKMLSLGIRESFDIMLGKDMGYRITNISADETLFINLNTADKEALLALYAKYGAPATKYDFDYRSDDSTVKNHTIIYPATKSGEFYLLVVYSGSAAMNNNSASVSLFAKLASFEILEAFPSAAAPIGNVTMGIKGTLIPEDVHAFLFSKTINISASFVYYFSSVSVYATFDITNASIGESFSLHLCSKTHKLNATLSGALETIQGAVGAFSVKMVHPSQVLVGTTSTVSIDIENIGDTDIQSPLLLVNVEGEGLIKFITDAKETYYMKRYIIFSPPVNGPGGIFAPRAYTRLLFEAKQTNLRATRIKITVCLVQPNDESFGRIQEYESFFKPSNYDESTWKTIWTNFRALIGETTSTLSKKLCEISNQFSLAGRRVHIFQDYLNLLLEVSDGALRDKVVVWVNDINQISRENPKIQLGLERFVSSKISLRAMDGPLGKGWISPYWSTFIKTINSSSATLYLENVAYEYSKTRDGIYMNKLGPDLFVVKSGYVLTDTLHGRSFHFDSTTLKLLSIISLIDSSMLQMQYDDYLRLMRVRHSDGGYMDMEYDSKNRISVIQTKNDTIIGHKTMLYSYHETKNLLMSVTVNEETTYYDYDDDMNLVAVRNADGSVFTASYSREGFLTEKIYTLPDGTLQESTQYSYDQAARVKVSTSPEKTNTIYTFDENAEVIARKKDGLPTVKFIKTLSSKFVVVNDRVIQSTVYDKEKRTVHIEDANGDSITVMYGSSEDMEAFYDGGGNMYKFERNMDHSISQIIYPDGSDRKFVYNGSSHDVISQTGKHIKYIFNKDHQITFKDIGDGWPSVFEYNTNGRMVKATKGTSITIDYKQFLPSSITHENGRVINYFHEKKNLMTGTTASFKLNNTVPYLYDAEYKYDPRGNLIEVWDKIMIKKLLTVDYDSRGRISRKILGNGAITKYEYNKQTGFLEALFNYHVNGSLSSKFEYEYDTHQRRIKLHTVEGTYKFQYDPSGQLNAVENPLGVLTEYSYDNRKNRIKVKEDSNESLYTVNALNQYERSGDMTFKYDKNGNLIKKTGVKTRTLSYNEDNQLLSIETPTLNCSLTYDALGSLESLNCTDASGTSSQRHYLTDKFGLYGSDVLMQIDVNGTDRKVTRYFHGADQLGLIAMGMDGDYFYFQFDPLGSVVSILSSSEVLNSYQYDTFGLVVKSHKSLENPFKFVGQWGVMQIPGIAELYFMRARFYDAEIGRFLSVDPLGIGGRSKNFYVYAYNNPVHLRDPNGKIIWALLGGGALNVGEYMLMSRLEGKDITWGGATTAFVDGVIDSAVSELKTVGFTVKLGVAIGKGLYHTIYNNVIQHTVDHTPYDWDHFWHDLKENELSEIESTIKDSFLDLLPKPIQRLETILEKVYEVCDERSDKCRPLIEAILAWIISRDPNDIISPSGYGAARFIAKDTVLEYTIRFENDENATASAQRVFIVHAFDEDLDPISFRLGSYGFGNVTRQLHFQTSTEQTTVNLTMELGIYIQVVAGVDLVKKQATWEFQAIDMDTGLPPTNVSKGFLPPNNGTSGQGFAHFSIKVKSNAPTLSRIDANATIYFDQNDPIDTPSVFNTIDDSAPNVTTTVIQDPLSEGVLVLSFNSTDIGAGVQEINLYSREAEGYILLKTGIKESLTSLNLNQGKNYTLLPIPVDNVGNRLQINDAVEYQLVFIAIPRHVGTCSCSGHSNCSEAGNICSCDVGFFGTFCNETVIPQYPPMLEVTVIDGHEDEPLQFYLAAKTISGPVDRLYLQVEGFPNETLFSKGNISQGPGGNEVLHLNQDDFGTVNMSLRKGFSGRLTLEVTAFAEEGNKTLQQKRHYPVYIEPQFTFSIKACLSENRTESVAEIRVEFNYTEKNMSGVIDIAFMPPYFKLSKGQQIELGKFQLTDADLGNILYVQTDMKYSNIPSIEISLDFTVIDNLKSHWKMYHKAHTIKCICHSDCKTQMTTMRIPVETITPTVREQITNLKVKFDYDIPTQDDLNDKSVYERYLSEIKAVLMQLLKRKLDDHLRNINILYISRGSLIVEFETITDDTMEATSQLSASLLSLQSMQLLGRPSRLMSLTFVDGNVTVVSGSNLNGCTFMMHLSPCQKNYECQVENDRPVCKQVVSEVRLFSLDETVTTIVIASVGGLFGLLVLIFVIFMISYVCMQHRQRKKKSNHPLFSGDEVSLNRQEEDIRMDRNNPICQGEEEEEAL